MSDALLSPQVGGFFWAVTAACFGISSYQVRRRAVEGLTARMGIMAAFVFASQMVNFSIPGTGSSGHLCGGLLLAIVLGPWAAFLAVATVLLVQALFFADGGLLAYGANVFNLGFFTSFIIYPLIFRPLIGDFSSRWRVVTACVVAGVVSLQLAALGVVLETLVSGISALPFKTFVALMLPIHLLIGLIEGLVTAGILLFMQQRAPEVLGRGMSSRIGRWRSWATMACVSALIAAGLSLIASDRPDGLEWAIGKVTGAEEISGVQSKTHEVLAGLQQKISLFADYSIAEVADKDASTSLAGFVGGLLVLVFAALWGLFLRAVRKPQLTRQ